jgi:hypothetical protein
MTNAAVLAAFCVGITVCSTLGAATTASDRASASRPTAPQIVVNLSPIANFVYQLDCISGGLRSCGGRDDYVALWRHRFGVDSDRSADVSAWRAAFSGSQDLLIRARIASFEAKSIDDYLRRIDVLFPPASARRVRTITNAHYPAFLRWWRTSNVAARERRVQAFRAALRTPPIAGELSRLYRFFAVPGTATRELDLALFYRPMMGPLPLTTGEYLGDDWSVAEFGSTEDLANRLGVVLHEYTHYVYSKMPADERNALGKMIVDAEPVHGSAMWSLFNEAIATAVGNGRIYRSLVSAEAWQAMLARERSFYSDAPIDAAAKAILPLVDATLDKGGTVTAPSFANAYDAALDAHLATLWRAPSLVLGEFRALADDRFDKSVLTYAIRTFHAHSVWYDVKPCCGAPFAQWWKDSGGSSRVALIHKEHATQSPLLDAATAACFAARPDHQAGYVIARNGEWTDIVVVASEESARTAIDSIARMPTLEPGTYYVSSRQGDAAAATGCATAASATPAGAGEGPSAPHP